MRSVTPGGKFTRDPFPSSTSREENHPPDMVRNGTAISITSTSGPQKTVPHTVQVFQSVSDHGFKTRTKQLGVSVSQTAYKDFAVKRMKPTPSRIASRERAFFHADLANILHVSDQAAHPIDKLLLRSPASQPAPVRMVADQKHMPDNDPYAGLPHWPPFRYCAPDHLHGHSQTQRGQQAVSALCEGGNHRHLSANPAPPPL